MSLGARLDGLGPLSYPGAGTGAAQATTAGFARGILWGMQNYRCVLPLEPKTDPWAPQAS